MKIAVLTTQTLHHSYFIREICKQFPVDIVISEQKGVKPPFEIHHPFEDDREDYEQELWFTDNQPLLSDFASTLEVDSINDAAVSDCIISNRPDIVIVFGTTRIRKALIDASADRIINLHGGDPEYYRGLDSHLWAIYHNDFSNLSVTLHTVNEELDDGRVIAQEPIALSPGIELKMLRSLNTEICVRLCLNALDMYSRFGNFITRPQRKIGRYYSFMPAVMKTICKNKFDKYINKL